MYFGFKGKERGKRRIQNKFSVEISTITTKKKNKDKNAK